MSNNESLIQLAEAWIRLHAIPEDSPERVHFFWAYGRLSDLVQESPEEAWQAIQTIRLLDQSDQIISNLAAGPVEELLASHGENFIERFELTARNDDQFKRLLGAVWRNEISDVVWERIQEIASPSW